MARMPTANTGEQPLRARTYLGVAFLSLLVALGVFVLLILGAPQLVASGLDHRLFYFALIPLGFSAAAFVHGAMRSLAGFKGKVFSGTLELGGPAVIAVLTVLGGFLLVPQPALQSLVVNVSAPKKASGWQGMITLQAGTVRLLQRLDANGQARFADLPRQFLADSVRLWVEVPGFHAPKSGRRLAVPPDRIIDLELIPELPKTSIRGRVLDRRTGAPLKGAIVNFGSGVAIDTTDGFGNFQIEVPARPGEQLTVAVLHHGRLGYDRVVTVPAKLELIIEFEAKR